MPIKQVVCVICKETVNKAVTYHVGGMDRACRKHEGVAEKKTALDQAKAKKATDQLQKVEHLHQARQDSMWEPMKDPSIPRCWVCMNTGIRQQEFYFRVLVEMQKQEKILGGPVNPFDPKHRIHMKDRCIFVILKEKALGILKFVREDFRQIVDMSGVLSICGDCCGTLKIEPLEPIKSVSLEDAVVLGMLMKPVIEEIAVKELVRDN